VFKSIHFPTFKTHSRPSIPIHSDPSEYPNTTTQTKPHRNAKQSKAKKQEKTINIFLPPLQTRADSRSADIQDQGVLLEACRCAWVWWWWGRGEYKEKEGEGRDELNEVE
jgi:hypothetical protein